MQIRDALESDAEALASLADRPVEATRDMIHERSVRVAITGVDEGCRNDPDVDGHNMNDPRSETEDHMEDPGMETKGERSDADASNSDARSDEIVGFVTFDVRTGVVHVTDFNGTQKAMKRLLKSPQRFAQNEGMDVETVIQNDEHNRIDVIEFLGFDSIGDGPRFQGRPTTRFRLELNGKTSDPNGSNSSHD
ncbi:hypothetical protein [Halorubrum vacuolatum]|uniref:N-acetyltransferase domain-containing protein n=1 Tax=Halorubrum vacuolatum TaxID=63740 RepID=A0A238XH62_HALVU|nr:hypothetical protein [Halorubrum vacuolatum]SNR58346.1 hypothetical protein SAMN06264855_11813 [Halorubrum vacuolatum]